MSSIRAFVREPPSLARSPIPGVVAASLLALPADAADLPFDTAKQNGAVSVRDRVLDAYRPDGIRMGNYLIFLDAGVATTYDDNVQGVAENKQSDFRHELSSTVKFESHLPRHLLDAMFGISAVKFNEFTDMDHVDGFGSLRGRLDIDHAHSVFGSASSHYTHEERFEFEAPKNAREPVPYLHNKAEFGVARDAGRLHGSVGVRYESWNYSDVLSNSGSHIEQDDRDVWIASPFARLGYRISPGYQVTAGAATIFQENRGNATYDRDATGYEVTAGLDMEITTLLKASFKAGWRYQDYDQANLLDISAPVWEGRLQWLITPTVTLSFFTRRSVYATTYGESSGRLDTIHGAKFEYEMWRNLIVTGEAEYRHADFIGDSRNDVVYIGRLSAEYAHTKNFLFTFEYEHQLRQSDVTSTDVDKNRIMFGAKYRF